jgi:hypothetical protein
VVKVELGFDVTVVNDDAFDVVVLVGLIDVKVGLIVEDGGTFEVGVLDAVPGIHCS